MKSARLKEKNVKSCPEKRSGDYSEDAGENITFTDPNGDLFPDDIVDPLYQAVPDIGKP